MDNFNSYWPIYKNIEEEVIQLTKYINFSDDQLNVYSMYIANLIIRIVIEIEALSKELYQNNGGPNVYDDNGNLRNLFFDTDCIQYLDDKWGICNRDIIVSCSKFNFINQQYKIIKPLKKANKSGTSSARWNKAYQAIKHDRQNNLKKGNLENLIYALGALYILNIYYRNETYEYGTTNLPNSLFDNRLGSEIFAASFADASKASIGNDENDTAIDKAEREKISTALCIIKYKDDEWKKIHEELKKYNNQLINGLIKEPEFTNKLKERINIPNVDIKTIFESLIGEMQIDYIKKNPPINFGKILINGKKEVILNKGQEIYKTNL